MRKTLDEANIEDVTIVSATDAATISSLDPELKRLFRNNHFFSRVSMIATTLSHYKLWQQLTQDTTTDCYLIMEDDVQLDNDLLQFAQRNANFVEKCHVLFFGYKQARSSRPEKSPKGESSIQQLDISNYESGAFCYSITKEAARTICDFVAQHGMAHEVDKLLALVFPLDVFEASPPLAHHKDDEDTDVLRNFDTVDTGTNDAKMQQIVDHSFVLVKDLDQVGQDIQHVSRNKSISLQKAFLHHKCIAFNTFGYLKHSLKCLTKPSCFKEGDGIYIRRSLLEQVARGETIVENLSKEAASEALAAAPTLHEDAEDSSI
jgi:GR25 family glycosyltransferase involved in LPS biosynthesis